MNYNLGERAKFIYDELEKHCRETMKFETIFYLELSMLADAFANYFDAAEFCAANGSVYELPTKTGKYPMIRPEYNVKKTEYGNILKHAGKYGLNPSDFDKLKVVKPEEKKKAFNLTEPMKIAK